MLFMLKQWISHWRKYGGRWNPIMRNVLSWKPWETGPIHDQEMKNPFAGFKIEMRMLCVWDLLAFPEYPRWEGHDLAFTAGQKHSDHLSCKNLDLEMVLIIYRIALRYLCQSQWQITGFDAEEMEASSHCQKGNCDFLSTMILIFPKMCNIKHVLRTKLTIWDCYIPLHLPTIIVQQTLLQVWGFPEGKYLLFFCEHTTLKPEKIRTG